MNAKCKGTSAERELIHMLWERKWAAHRIAGSGSSHYPSPDIIAGNGGRALAIECKACAGDIQYFTKQEIEDLVMFSRMFGAEPYVATKFNRMGWYFMTPMHLKETAAAWAMSRKMCELYGKKIDDAIR